MDQPLPIPVCEAKTGPLKDFGGFAPLWCNGTRGLRFTTDANGHKHWFCPARGHAVNVRMRVSRSFPVARTPGELTMEYGR